MADRQNGIPVHVDISDLPMKRGIITNRNKFILGPSGSGKSFFTNHLVRNYYEQGAHILLVDTGNSYQGLCRQSDILQPVLHRFRTVRCGKAREHQDSDTDLVETGGRGTETFGRGGALGSGERLYP